MKCWPKYYQLFLIQHFYRHTPVFLGKGTPSAVWYSSAVGGLPTIGFIISRSLYGIFGVVSRVVGRPFQCFFANSTTFAPTLFERLRTLPLRLPSLLLPASDGGLLVQETGGNGSSVKGKQQDLQSGGLLQQGFGYLSIFWSFDTGNRCYMIAYKSNLRFNPCGLKGGQNWILRPRKIYSFISDLKQIIRSGLICQSWYPAKTVQNQIRDRGRILSPMTSHTQRDTETHDTQT